MSHRKSGQAARSGFPGRPHSAELAALARFLWTLRKDSRTGGVLGPPRAARGVLRMPSEVSALGDTGTRKDILSMAGRDSSRLAERRETSE